MLKRSLLPMPRSFQGGAALLIFLTIVVLGGAYLLVSALKSSRLETGRERKTAQVLAEAKDALLAYARLYPEQYGDMPVGFLPCPDLDGDGSAEAVCGSKGQSAIGRLPWRTLKLPPLRDGDGECLWYAVSGTYKYNPKYDLSSDSDGLFVVRDANGNTVLGGSSASQAIAIVFAPGRPINNQDRSASGARTECGSGNAADGVNQPASYLDALAGVNNAVGTLTGAPAGSPGSVPLPTIPPLLASVFTQAAAVVVNGETKFNDVLVAVTADDYTDVFHRMDEWVAQRVVGCYQSYGGANSGLFPWASTLASPPDYYDDSAQCYGRIANAVGSGSVDALQGLSNSNGDNSALNPRWENFPAAGRCFYEAGATANDWWWWSGWKDQVFVAVDPNFAPKGSADNNSIISQLQLDGVPQQGVVMVAGRRLPGQDRSPGMGAVSDYLEGDNATWADYSFTAVGGGGGYNDVVLPFNTSAGGMAAGASCVSCTCGMCNCSPGMSGEH